MAQAFAHPLKCWAALLSAAALVACGTPPRPVQLPSPVEAPVAQPAPAPSVPYVDAVAARFPDPNVNYSTPAFEPGRTDFTTQAELHALLRGLVREGGVPSVHLLNLGASQNGLPLEALLFTRNADASPAALLRAGRPTVLLVGQQHGDEPAGSEALIVMAQELARGRLQSLLDRINVVILPRANPDGAQASQRVTANGIDANRDHLLLNTPEAQAQARLVRDYQPAVIVDAHEYTVVGRYLQKFGTVQRYDALVQYAMTANMPAFVTKASEEWFRQPLLASLKKQGLSAEWYYTTSMDLEDKKLSMGGTQPDTGRNVNGLKNAVSILIETRGVGIGRMHLKRRVHTHVTAITSVLHSAADRGADLLKLRQYVEAELSAQACQGRAVVEAGPTPTEYTVQMLDPVTGADKPLTVNWDSALVLRDIKVRNRPCGYWLAADQGDAVLKLRMLGVRVEKVTGTGVMQGETYTETSRQQGARQDVRGTIADAGSVVRVEVQTAPALVDAPLGSYYVPLSQPLANLVMAALEPDTQNSYFANRIISAVGKEARVMALPGMKMVVMP
ncbi:MAG: M14 family metallocarboxypeptidase [Rhizobacter sp.]